MKLHVVENLDEVEPFGAKRPRVPKRQRENEENDRECRVSRENRDEGLPPALGEKLTQLLLGEDGERSS